MTQLLNNRTIPSAVLTTLSIAITLGGCQTIDKPSKPPIADPAAIVLETPPEDKPVGIWEDIKDTTATSATSAPLYTWTQYGNRGNLSARAILKDTSTPTCPNLSYKTDPTSVTVLSVPMTLRSSTPPSKFDNIWVCQVDIPAGSAAASIGAINLPLGSKNPQNIAVLGDTGCRMTRRDQQNCNDPKDWTYATIAAQAASENPDLTLHVGDYHYREKCPFSGCPFGVKASSVGYKWESWEEDFFKPSGALLTKAPFIFTRGNHEDYSRAWKGWYYFLSPGDTFQSSSTIAAPHIIEFDEFQVAVLDTSNSYSLSQSRMKDYFAYIFAKANANPTKPTWLSTHVPIMAATSYGISNDTLINASAQAGGFPKTIAMNLAGHVHIFEKLEFTNGNPPQMVFGASGTKLDKALYLTTNCSNNNVRCQLQKLNADPSKFLTSDSFDYGIISPGTAPSDWKVEVKTINGKPAPPPFYILKNRNTQTPS